MGTENGASWNDQEKPLDPNRSGMARSPKQERGASPSVRKQVEEARAEAVAVAQGSTETEAPVSTRNLPLARESSRNTKLESPAGA